MRDLADAERCSLILVTGGTGPSPRDVTPEATADVCDRILGNCLCPLGDSNAMIVASYVRHFRAEFEAHVEKGGCPVAATSSLTGVRSPVDELYRGRVGQEAAL